VLGDKIPSNGFQSNLVLKI